MNNVIEVAILTKSSKNGGYCVAGIETTSGNWIRLVSSEIKSHGALSNQNMKCQDRSVCQVLDVVRVPVLRPAPNDHQPENILIDEDRFWEKVGYLSVDELLTLHPAENHPNLLGNIYPYITEERIGTVGRSLILVEVYNLVISHPNETSTKASFNYKFNQYDNIAVTDWDYRHADANFDKAILVMSLPDIPYNERRYYKFIAKVFPL
jgi:hypothetical protein